MNNWIKAAVIATFLSIGIQAALAEPMKCSGEQKACMAPCARLPAAQIQACVENCRTSQAYCMRSGCWASGASRYCGLMKQ